MGLQAHHSSRHPLTCKPILSLRYSARSTYLIHLGPTFPMFARFNLGHRRMSRVAVSEVISKKTSEHDPEDACGQHQGGEGREGKQICGSISRFHPSPRLTS